MNRARLFSRGNSPLRSGLFLLLCALWVAPAAAQERKVHLYRVQHRTAEELLPLAETAMGGRGNAAVDRGTNALLLIGPPETVAETLALLEEMDRARRTVLLQYESRRLQDLEAAGVQVHWSVAAGDLRIGNVILPPGHSGVHVMPHAEHTQGESRLQGSLRVLEGEVGQILMGTAVPVHNPYGLVGTTTYVSGDSGFEARPRILGDGRVEVEINPFDGSVTPGGTVHYTRASTRVIARPGETAVIGGLTQSGSSQRVEGFGGVAVERARDDLVLLLTVQVE